MKSNDKKNVKKILVALAVVMTIMVMSTINTKAAPAKSTRKVVYELKNGTLTIKGKGKMPKTMTFEDNKKIKKVVIKKGVTSISAEAFLGCSNLKNVKIANTVKEIGENSFDGTGLKKVVVPRSVKKIGVEAFYNCDNLTTITMPGKFVLAGDINEERYPEIMNGDNITTINFNTNLELDTVMYCEGMNWNVSKKDPNYTTIDGAIYSKDGKSLVRVPKGMKEFTMAQGCEIFSLQAILYGQYVPDDGIYSCCSQLEKFTISESVKCVEDKKYAGEYSSVILESFKEIDVKSKQLDAESIVILIANLKEIISEANVDFNIDDVMKMFGDRVTVDGDFYILDKEVLIGYSGKGGTVIIPEVVKIIADATFSEGYTYSENRVKKVVLPEEIEKIGDEAFYYCRELEEINLPNNIYEIGDRAFEGTKIKKVEIPNSVTKWGEYVFSYTEITEASLPDEMTIIPAGMFAYSNLAIINVPSKLKEIKKEAFIFTNVNVQAFLDNKNLTTIGENSFMGTKWTTLYIPSHIKEIGEMAFDKFYEKRRKIRIQGDAINYEINAFSGCYTDRLTDTLIFEKGMKKAFTALKIHYVSHEKNKTEISIDWLKVKGADGYDIRISSSKTFKKDLKKISVKKKTEKIITIDKKLMNVCVKIRPYKVMNGKKVYGRWSSDIMSMYE